MAATQDSLRISETHLRRRYFGGERGVMILGVCTVLGALFLIFGYVFLKIGQRDSKSSVFTTAQIIDKYRRAEPKKNGEGEGDGSSICWIRYRYQDEEGKSYEGRDTLDVREWDKVQKGDGLAVEYKRANPQKSWSLVSYNPAGYALAISCLIVGTALSIGSGLVGLGCWLDACRKVRLVRDGTPVVGEVINRVDKEWLRFSDFVQYRILYRFTDPTGVERTATTSWLPRDVACCFAAGDSLLVLCDPKQPTRYVADIYQVRRVDLAASVP